jgi:hypothetical protein
VLQILGIILDGSKLKKLGVIIFITLGKFDDDKVMEIPEDDIKKLEGGGDWHTAYICLYRSKVLE